MVRFRQTGASSSLSKTCEYHSSQSTLLACLRRLVVA